MGVEMRKDPPAKWIIFIMSMVAHAEITCRKLLKNINSICIFSRIIMYYSNNENIFSFESGLSASGKADSISLFTKIQVLDLKTRFLFSVKTLLSIGARCCLPDFRIKSFVQRFPQ